MDLNYHYQAYKASVSDGTLKGFVDKAKAIQTSIQGLSVYDYLKRLVEIIQSSVAENHEENYKKHIILHQQTVINLFRRMANDIGDKSKILDLGYDWIRFSDHVIEFDKFTWIPRYSSEFNSYIQSTKPVFSTNEMKIILAIKNEEITENIVKQKTKGKYVLTEITPLAQVSMFSINNVNDERHVRDWTMKLF